MPVSARCPPIEPQNLKWLNCPLKEHEAFAQSSEKDPNGRDRPPRISCHTDDAGTREDALGPRAKSLGLPHTPYPFNTPLRPVPESYQPPKPSASPGSTKPNPQPPTHFHSTHLSIPPKSRWGAGPSAALHLEECYPHCEDEEANANRGSSSPTRAVVAFESQGTYCGSLLAPEERKAHQAKRRDVWTRPTPLLSHCSFPNGQNEVWLDNL